MIPDHHIADVHNLLGLSRAPRLSRRNLLRLAGISLTIPAVGTLLSACGGDDDDATPTVSAPAADPTPTDGAPAVEPTPIDEDQTPEAEAETPTAAVEVPAGQVGGDASIYWMSGTAGPLEPLYTTSAVKQQAERLIFGALIKISAGNEPTPDIAESFEVSEDATTYTFNMRQGMQFTDGEPLTSDDVRFTLERAIDRRTGSYWGGRLSGIAGAEEYGNQEADTISGIDTPDDHTVILTLADPDAVFLLALGNFSGLGIVPKHVLEGIPPEDFRENSFWVNPDVTAGAYKVARHLEDQYMELEKNEAYGGPPPNLDRIFLRIATVDVALAQLERGEIDVMTLPTTEIARTRELQGVTVVSGPSAGRRSIHINVSLPHLSDKRVRQAMIHAIDRQSMIDELLLGEARIVNAPIFGPEWMGNVEEHLNPYEYDPDRARELLEESGWDSERTLEMIYHTGNPQQHLENQILQEQWREVGINVELFTFDAAEINRRYTNPGLDFELYSGGGGVHGADPDISALQYHSRNFSPGGQNTGHYSNPEVDALYDRGKAISDRDERREIYIELAKILNDETPVLHLWSPNSTHGVRDRLIGFVPGAHPENKLWNAEEWSVND